MSEELQIAIEARESAKAAHHRLDRMNGSIDRLVTRVEQANATGQEILRRLDRDEGIDEGASSVRATVLDSKRWVIGIATGFICSGLFTALFTLIVRRHG